MRYILPKLQGPPLHPMLQGYQEPGGGGTALIRTVHVGEYTGYFIYCWPVTEQGEALFCFRNELWDVLAEIAEYLQTHTMSDHLERIEVGDHYRPYSTSCASIRPRQS